MAEDTSKDPQAIPNIDPSLVKKAASLIKEIRTETQNLKDLKQDILEIENETIEPSENNYDLAKNLSVELNRQLRIQDRYESASKRINSQLRDQTEVVANTRKEYDQSEKLMISVQSNLDRDRKNVLASYDIMKQKQAEVARESEIDLQLSNQKLGISKSINDLLEIPLTADDKERLSILREELGVVSEHLHQRDGLVERLRDQLKLSKDSYEGAKGQYRTQVENYKVVVKSHVEAKNKFLQENKTLQVLAGQSDEITDALKKTKGITKELGNQVKILNGIDSFVGSTGAEYGKIKTLVMDIAKGGLTAFLAIVKASYDRWLALDKAAEDFRRTTGLIVTQTRAIDAAVREVNVSLQEMGVGLEEAYRAAGALYGAFGTSALVSKDLIKDTAMMAANLGINVANLSKFNSLFGLSAKKAGMTSIDMAKSATALANMGGVAPDEVIKDMANASEDTLKFLSKSPMQLIRATVEARRLGTTIDSMSKSARGLLNFHDSITSELEASALIGKALNFQEARAAAYAGDIVKSRELAMKQIAKAGDFTRLNVFQQEALAKAAGMTVEEVTKQQNQQKMLAALKNSSNAEDRKAYAEYEAMNKRLKEDEKAASKNLLAKGREMARQQLMQSEMNKLTNSLKSIWISITDALLPIANAIMPIVIGSFRLLVLPIKIIAGLVRGFLSAFDGIGKSLRSGASGALTFEKVVSKISGIVDKFLVPSFEFLGEAIGRVLSLIVFLRIAAGKASAAFAPFDYVSQIFTRFSENIMRVFSGTMKFKELFLRTYISIKSAISGVYGSVRELFNGTSKLEKIFSKVRINIGGLFDFVGNSARRAVGAIESIGVGIFRFFSKLPTELGSFFGRFPKLINALKTSMNPVIDIFSTIRRMVAGIFGAFSGGAGSVGRIFGIFGRISGIFGPLMSGASTIFKFIGTFVKFLGPIGLIINAVQILWDLGSKLMDIWSDDKLDIGDKILNSILAIPGAIFDVMVSPFIDLGVWILKKFGVDIPDGMVDGIKSVGKQIFEFLMFPFVKVFQWVKKWLMGSSPSKIGLGIVNGIKSVGSMLFDALTYPFRKVMDFISGIFGGKGNLGTTIVNGIKTIGSAIFDVLTWPFKKIMEYASKIPIIGKFFGGKDATATVNSEIKNTTESVSTQTLKIDNMSVLTESMNELAEVISDLTETLKNKETTKTENGNSAAIVEKLDELIGLMLDGAIAVNIDGIAASRALARVST